LTGPADAVGSVKVAEVAPSTISRAVTSMTIGLDAAAGRIREDVLFDQTTIVGLGKIYTDECLHRARIHSPVARWIGRFADAAPLIYAALQRRWQVRCRQSGSSIRTW
jgi:formamidopyrimidine-DNA glycosylase